MKQSKQKGKSQQPPSLLGVLFSDILISHWIVTLLALLFVCSSMFQAITSHNTRRLTANWQEMREQYQDYQLSSDALRLELTALSEADRISNLARKELGMIEVTTKNEKVIAL